MAGCGVAPAVAQSIIAAPDGTGTLVTPDGDRITIHGGTLSADQYNLFHSFVQFGLQPGQIADFLANPSLQNILARVTGGEPSHINGLLQVSGGSPNLYLMNPAGIVFGPSAQLNLPADFTATTATGIEFGTGVFSATDYQANYHQLVGDPQALQFASVATGAIVNGADLSVQPEQRLTLAGGMVFNTGELQAPGGEIQVIGVPGTNRVRLSQPGSLLSLELAMPNPDTSAVSPVDLPTLLTGPITPEAVGIEFNSEGSVQLAAGEIALPLVPGLVAIAGTVDASTAAATTVAPTITVTGDRVALLGGQVDASSAADGGQIRIGETARRTFVDRDSFIRADATGEVGNGGNIFVWSDEITAFYGELSVQAGAQGGNGGFVEVSSAGRLGYDGRANLDAPQGQAGTLYLDPTNITIDGAGGNDLEVSLDNVIAAGDGGAANFFINAATLGGLTGTIILEATNLITVNQNIVLNPGTTFVLRAPSIETNNPITGDNITFVANETTINAGVTGTGTFTLELLNPADSLTIGATAINLPNRQEFGDGELNQVTGFSAVRLGNTNGTGEVDIRDNAAVRDFITNNGNNLTIVGAGSLDGPDSTTNWNLTGTRQGNFNLGASTVAFQNVARIEGGSFQDTFRLNGGVNFGGVLDGGFGRDVLDYSQWTTPVVVNLATNTATGTTGVFSIEETIQSKAPGTVIPPNITNPNVTTPTPSLPGLSNDDTEILIPDRETIARLIDDGRIEDAIAGVECLFGAEYLDYLDRQEPCRPLPVDRLQTMLRDRESGLIYALVRPSYLELILITADGNPVHRRIPLNKAELLNTVKEFRQEVTDPVRRLTVSYRPSAQQLYQWLIAPLASELAQADLQSLLFSLDQGLRTLPLAALYNGEQFLVERYGLSLIPTVSLTRTEYQPIREIRSLAMGASEFEFQAPLPAVPLELEAIAQYSDSGNALLNEAFTWENWQQQQDERFSVVHLATHAEFLPGELENSFIQLWDRAIHLGEINQIPWEQQNVDLLVLSACRTALGNVEAEFGFAGLAVQTGVPSAIASIWYASDIGTLALMSEFYRQLPMTQTRAEALRQAQLALINRQIYLQDGQLIGANLMNPLPAALARLSDRNFIHPYYWSGFTLIGNPW